MDKVIEEVKTAKTPSRQSIYYNNKIKNDSEFYTRELDRTKK